MSQRFEINTGVICAEDGGGRCPDGAPSVYSRPFSPSWPRLTALLSPAGGLAAAYSGLGRSRHMHVGMNRAMPPVWAHEIGEEPRHWGPPAGAHVAGAGSRGWRRGAPNANAARCLPARRGGRRCPRRDGDLVGPVVCGGAADLTGRSTRRQSNSL